MSQNVGVVIIGGIIGVGLLLIVILIPISFSGLEYYEYGFKRQKSTGKVNTDEVYAGGKHFIGPDYEFKTFKSDAHFVDLHNMEVFTADKLNVHIDVYFQYFLRKDDLTLLHERYDINYDSVVRKTAVAILKDKANDITTKEYFQDHIMAENTLFRALRDKLGGPCCHSDCSEWKMACPPGCIEQDKCVDNGGLWVDVKYFQLGGVDIDDELEKTYLTVMLNIEKTEREKLKQDAQVWRKATNAKVENIQNQAKEIREKAQAESQRIGTVSKANFTVTVEKARSNGLKSLYKRLNIADQSIKNSFDYLRTLRGLDHVHFTVDFQQRIVGGLG